MPLKVICGILYFLFVLSIECEMSSLPHYENRTNGVK